MDKLLSRLGVVLVSELGGRVNSHWLVGGAGEQMVLRRWGDQPACSIEYERRLVAALKEMGWPVAPLEPPLEFEGRLWSLSPFFPGEPPPVNAPSERRSRGRRLAEFHLATAEIHNLYQRPGWRRCEEILADPELDKILSENENRQEETVRIVRWHLDRARSRAQTLRLADRPGIPIHGDFTTWNLRFQAGRLSGILDFELSRNDHRAADFNLAWRGRYDEVIQGYEEVSPLDPEERLAITPVWWAQLIEDACRDMRRGVEDEGWTIQKLLARSPYMGPDSTELP